MKGEDQGVDGTKRVRIVSGFYILAAAQKISSAHGKRKYSSALWPA